MHLYASDFYKNIFGSKVYKISLDAGCTCPNRDGTKGLGGCIFCSSNGSGDFVPEKLLSIPEQLEEAKKKVQFKLKNNPEKYIAYFQNFTNTYGDLSKLKEKWESALTDITVKGIAIGTRPDCLSKECVEYLKELSERTFVQLELGFQTSNQKTADFFNRGYENQIFFDAVNTIKRNCPKIHIVAHVMFGLPGESESDMLKTVSDVVASGVDGIKITSLYVLKNTKLADLYLNKKYTCLEMEEYMNLLKKALCIIPEKIIIHRLTGDPPKSLILAPLWTTDKKRVLNRIKSLQKD